MSDSASLRAAKKLYAVDSEMSEEDWKVVRHEASLIDAEYESLIEAVRDEISSCPGCDGCGIVEDDYTDDEEICGECEALRKALAHIEGDATP